MLLQRSFSDPPLVCFQTVEEGPMLSIQRSILPLSELKRELEIAMVHAASHKSTSGELAFLDGNGGSLPYHKLSRFVSGHLVKRLDGLAHFAACRVTAFGI